LYYFAYNFIKIHRTFRVTPATATGVADRLWEPTNGGRKSGMSTSHIVYLATALVILFLAVHPKLITLKDTQQRQPYQALARLCLVAMSLFIQ
jgi:hypothetical protein